MSEEKKPASDVNEKSAGAKIVWADFIRGAIVGVLAGMLVTYVIMNGLYSGLLSKDEKTEIVPGPSTVDFVDVVLDEAGEHSEFIMMVQPLSVNTTITKSGLANLPIFSKVKNVTYYGTGVYTVDLSKINSRNIRVDEENHVVNILIPHAVLQYVNPDLEKTEFQDTERGWLAFGEIRLTAEESNELEKDVLSTMEERLSTDDLLIQADEFAILKTWEIFQPVISAVSNEYSVEIEFSE